MRIRRNRSIDDRNALYVPRIRALAPLATDSEVRVIANAQRLGKGDTIVVGVCLELAAKTRWFGLCCRCIDDAICANEELQAARVPDGGYCTKCGLWDRDDVLLCRN